MLLAGGQGSGRPLSACSFFFPRGLLLPAPHPQGSRASAGRGLGPWAQEGSDRRVKWGRVKRRAGVGASGPRWPWRSFAWSHMASGSSCIHTVTSCPPGLLHRRWGGASMQVPPALACECARCSGYSQRCHLACAEWRCCVGWRGLPQGEAPGGGVGARSLSPGGGEAPPASLSQGRPRARTCTLSGPGVPEPHFLRFGLHGPHPQKAQPPLCPRLWGGLSVPGGPAGARCLNPWAAWQGARA